MASVACYEHHTTSFFISVLPDILIPVGIYCSQISVIVKPDRTRCEINKKHPGALVVDRNEKQEIR